MFSCFHVFLFIKFRNQLRRADATGLRIFRLYADGVMLTIRLNVRLK